MILKKTKVNSFTVQHKNFKHLLEHQGYSLELQMKPTLLYSTPTSGDQFLLNSFQQSCHFHNYHNLQLQQNVRPYYLKSSFL